MVLAAKVVGKEGGAKLIASPQDYAPASIEAPQQVLILGGSLYLHSAAVPGSGSHAEHHESAGGLSWELKSSPNSDEFGKVALGKEF